jgi:hypothetical protein
VDWSGVVVTAPDPGLTDLIAAHREGEPWTEYQYPSIFSSKPFVAYSATKMVKCSCGESMSADSFPAHVALVVEQHTNGRIAELEAELAEAKDDKFYARVELNADAQWKARAEKAEATIARVEAEAALLERMIRTAPWSRYTEVRRSHLRSLCTALEGPGEAG